MRLLLSDTKIGIISHHWNIWNPNKFTQSDMKVRQELQFEEVTKFPADYAD
jgi:hypothetical protein